jgi:hypothetical protein
MLNDYYLQKEAEFRNQRLEEVSRNAWKFYLPNKEKRSNTLKNLFTFKWAVRPVTLQKNTLLFLFHNSGNRQHVKEKNAFWNCDDLFIRFTHS